MTPSSIAGSEPGGGALPRTTTTADTPQPIPIINPSAVIYAKGAKGNNSDDDTAALAAAFTAAAAGRARIEVNPGIYKVTAGFALSSNLDFQGSGRGVTVFQKYGSFDLFQLYGTASGSAANHITRVTLRDFTMIGGGNGGRLIDIVYADNIDIERVDGIGNNGTTTADVGIDVVECWDSSFTDITLDGVNSSAVNSCTFWFRSGRAASGFGSSVSDTDDIRIRNIRLENWTSGGMRIEQGPSGGIPNQVCVDDLKCETHSLRGSALFVNAVANIHVNNIFVIADTFDTGFNTPQDAIVFFPVQSGSLTEVFITSNGATQVWARGVNIWTGAPVYVNRVHGQYSVAPTSGVHVDFQGGGPYAIGTITSNAPTNVRFAAGVQMINPYMRGLEIAQSAGAPVRAGTAVLVAGQVTVNNTSITANTLILLTGASGGAANQGTLSSTKVVGTSFTIRSTNAADTSTVHYLLVEMV